jgi:hypothetical protein
MMLDLEVVLDHMVMFRDHPCLFRHHDNLLEETARFHTSMPTHDSTSAQVLR